jgi:O-antigen/teichoic acid export membrane protein
MNPKPVSAEETAPYGGRFGEVLSLRRHAARGTIVNGAYQVGLAGLSVLRGLAAAALVSRTDYGLWGLLGLALWTVLGLKQLGVNDKYIQQSEPDQQVAFQRAFTMELIFAAVALPVIAVVVLALAAITAHPALVAPGLALGLAVPGVALQFPVWTFYRRMEFRRQRTLQAVDPVIAAIVTVLLAALGAGYWSLVIGTIAGAWAGAIVAVRASSYPLAIRYDRGTLRRYVGFSAPLLIGGLSVLTMFYVIYLAGNHLIGLAGLGAFTIVGNLVQFTDRADTIITETLYPALCAVQDRIDVLYEAFVKSNRLALMWAMPLGVGVSLFADPLVQFVLGEKWELAVGLLQIMGIVTAVHHIGFNWTAFFRARGVTRPVAVSGLVTSAAVIGAGIPLMESDGVVGLGWAFAIGEVASMIVRMRYLGSLFAGFNPLLHMARAIWPTAIAAGAILALRAAGASDATLALAVGQLVIYLVVTAVATVAFERQLLREAFGYFGIRLQRPALLRSASAARS